MTKSFFIEDSINVSIFSSSEATIAVLHVTINNNEYIWTGTAKKTPSDRFNAEVGLKLALGRALMSGAKQMLRQGNGLVKSIDDNAKASEEAKKTKPLSKFKITRRSRHLAPNKSSTPIVEHTPLVTHQ